MVPSRVPADMLASRLPRYHKCSLTQSVLASDSSQPSPSPKLLKLVASLLQLLSSSQPALQLCFFFYLTLLPVFLGPLCPLSFFHTVSLSPYSPPSLPVSSDGPAQSAGHVQSAVLSSYSGLLQMPLALLSLIYTVKIFPSPTPWNSPVLSLYIHLDHGLLRRWCCLQFHWGSWLASWWGGG